VATGERPDVAVLEVEALYRLELIPEPGLPHPKNAQEVVAVAVAEPVTMALAVMRERLLTLLVGLRLAITTEHAQTK
jgi:hypothetical protein